VVTPPSSGMKPPPSMRPSFMTSPNRLPLLRRSSTTATTPT